MGTGEHVLPRSVVTEDHRLEKATDSASEALAELRWHWTLDESNSKHVSIRGYAKQVGRSERTIRGYVNGYVLFRACGGARTLSECIERAGMSAETQVAAEAVAAARGVSLMTARKEYPTEVRHVREIARQKAEEKGTSVEREAPKVAQTVRALQQSDIRYHEEKKAKRGAMFLEIERHLTYALREVKKAVSAAIGAQLPAEDVEVLQSTVDTVRTALHVADKVLTGQGTERDWDTEIKALVERGG